MNHIQTMAPHPHQFAHYAYDPYVATDQFPSAQDGIHNPALIPWLYVSPFFTGNPEDVHFFFMEWVEKMGSTMQLFRIEQKLLHKYFPCARHYHYLREVEMLPGTFDAKTGTVKTKWKPCAGRERTQHAYPPTRVAITSILFYRYTEQNLAHVPPLPKHIQTLVNTRQ